MFANSTQFFAGIKNVADIKKLYHKLALLYHPDRPGGNLQTMQELNRQYQEALRRADGQTHVGEDKKEHTYHYEEVKEQDIIDFIDRLINSGVLNNGCEAYLIGTWVWIMGDTKPNKDTLKELHCRWHSKRECWYYTPDERRHFYSNKGLESLAAQYGASKVAGRKQKREEQYAIGD